MRGGRAASIVSGLGSVAGTTSGGSGERQDNPNFCEEKFGWARDAARGGPGTPRMISSGQLKKHEAAGKLPPLPISRVDSGMKMCFAWHVVGQCNERCKRARDHVAYDVNSEQYVHLDRWARTCYKVKDELEAALPITQLE